MEHKDTKRGERLAHVKRLKEKRKGYWGYFRNPRGTETKEQSCMSAKQLGRVSQYPSACSCTMCGNPRNWWGNSNRALTVHEISDREFFELELKGLEDEQGGEKEEGKESE